MTAQVTRIGKWTTKAALESAMEQLHDDDSLIIVAICQDDGMMKYWSANATNMQANWMADNVKADILMGSL